MYRLIEHTGDIGIEVKSKTLRDLFKESILALYSIFLKPLNQKVRGERGIKIEGKDMAELLVETLNEIIYLLEVKKIIFIDFKDFNLIQEGDMKILDAVITYDIMDKKNYIFLGSGVKAATYHDIIVKKIKDNEYYARVIIDV